MRNTLLAAVSHDLRTPLTSILGAAQAALPHAGTGASRDMLLQIFNQAQSMQQLIDNLLAMARLQQGGVHLNRQWFPVDELVGSALHQVRERLTDHPVHTDIPATLPLLHVDAVLMERLLVNLLDNAIKYTPSGTLISLAAKIDGPACVISIRDAGPGLPVHMDTAQLFEPFTRGQTETAVSGMGLGLALAQRIVQAHGGSLSAATAEAGTGAVFFIKLPLTQQPDIDA